MGMMIRFQINSIKLLEYGAHESRGIAQENQYLEIKAETNMIKTWYL